MTLSPLDEYPIHQAPLSMRHVATSDRNFYDRSYFNAHPSSDEHFSILCIRQDSPDGTPVLRQAVRAWPDGRVEDLGRPEVALRLADGTRQVTGATWHLREPDGSPLVVEVEACSRSGWGRGPATAPTLIGATACGRARRWCRVCAST